MRISDWSSDVCSSDLHMANSPLIAGLELGGTKCVAILGTGPDDVRARDTVPTTDPATTLAALEQVLDGWQFDALRSEEHTSELQSLMRISYAVFCLKKKKKQHTNENTLSQINNNNTHEPTLLTQIMEHV